MHKTKQFNLVATSVSEKHPDPFPKRVETAFPRHPTPNTCASANVVTFEPAQKIRRLVAANPTSTAVRTASERPSETPAATIKTGCTV